MRGGGRRSPPLTRKSSGGEVPRFVFPPARVNAGYNAVIRGPDGKFVGSIQKNNVSKLFAALNDSSLVNVVGSNLEGGSASREVEEKHSTGCNGADSGVICQTQPILADLGVYCGGGLEPRVGRDAALVGCDIHPPSIPNPSPSSSTVAMGDLGLDLDESTGTLLRTTAVCANVSVENSCIGAGNSFHNMGNVDAGCCIAPSSPSPINPLPSTDDSTAVLDDVMGDPNSTCGVDAAGYIADSNVSAKQGAGISLFECHMPHASSPTPPHPSPEVGGCPDDDEIMGASSPRAVQTRDSTHNFCTDGVTKSVWSKPGVVAVPPLEDLKHLPTVDGVVQLDNDEVNTFFHMFEKALVGRLFGKHIPYAHLFTELKRRWDSYGHFRLITLSNECFMCIFDSTGARDAILCGGPWMVAGQVLGLDVWSPGFSSSTSHGFVTPIWVRFPGLPLYCWGSKSLTSMAYRLGVPLWFDEATHKMGRGSFARMCIKIDLSKPLLPSIRIQGPEGVFVQQIEYEGLTSFCHGCGMVGHRIMSCPRTRGNQKAGASSQPQIPPLAPVSTPGSGPSRPHTATAPLSGMADTSPTFHGSSQAAAPAREAPSRDDDPPGEGGWRIVQPRGRNRRRPPSNPVVRRATREPPMLQPTVAPTGKVGRHSIFRFEASSSAGGRTHPPVAPKGRKGREVTHNGKAIFDTHVGTSRDVQEASKKRKSLVSTADEDASSFMPP